MCRNRLLCLSILCANIAFAASDTLYTESFAGAAVPALPANWRSSTVRSSSSNDFVTTASSVRSSPNCLFCTNATVDQWVMSAPLPIGGITPTHLQCWTRRSSTFLAKVVVEISMDDGQTFSVFAGDTLAATGAQSYVQSTLSLPRPDSGMIVRFRWRVMHDSSGSTGTFRLDDIVVYGSPRIDLGVVRMDLNSSPPVREGEVVNLTAVIMNYGVDTARGMLSLAVRTSSDSILGTPPHLLDSLAVSVLPPGDSASYSFSAFIPPPGGTIMAFTACCADSNTTNDTASLFLREGYARTSLIVNEIMYAPSTGNPEWIEVKNLRADTVALAGWAISDAVQTSKHQVSAGHCAIPPGGYAVLTKDSTVLRSRNAQIPSSILSVTGFPALNNDGDAVLLFDQSDGCIDSVVYSSTWGGGDGTSLERRDVHGSSVDSANWGTSIDAGGSTPGLQNSIRLLDHDVAIGSVAVTAARSQATVIGAFLNKGLSAVPPFGAALYASRDSLASGSPWRAVAETIVSGIASGDSVSAVLTWNSPPSGLWFCKLIAVDTLDIRQNDDTARCLVDVPFAASSLVINEIMPKPGTGKAEYVEVINAGSDSVDIRGWRLHDASTSADKDGRYILAGTSTFVPAGGYAVITTDSLFAASFPTAVLDGSSRLVVLHASSLGLNDSGDDVVLHDAAGTIIDSVAYLSSWHNPILADVTGRSLERIRPDLSSNDSRNWTSCTLGAGGTPGRRNSVFVSTLPSGAALTCSPNPFSPDADGFNDVTVVHYLLPLESATLSLSVYDVRGRRIRRLADHEPGAASGSIVWDGRTDNGDCAPIGMYIVLLQAAASNGASEYSCRTVVVLAGRL